jgi:hypothetical protein
MKLMISVTRTAVLLAAAFLVSYSSGTAVPRAKACVTCNWQNGGNGTWFAYCTGVIAGYCLCYTGPNIDECHPVGSGCSYGC